MNQRNIELICSEERIKEVYAMPGIFKGFNSSEFQAKYNGVLPLKGIELPEGFPIPETFFKGIYDEATEYLNRFPNCCEAHKRLKGEKWFKKADYTKLPIKAATQLFYTTKYMEERERDESWYKDITDYIEMNVLSFGQLPEGYGSPVGSFFYTKGIKIWLNEYSELPPKLKKQIVDYLDNRNEKNDTLFPDLNLLYETYQKWLSIFPFDIEYFKEQKEHFGKIFPLFTGEIEHNRFTGMYGGTPNTIEGLSAFLVNITTNLLQKANSIELVKLGVITDFAKHQFDLYSEAHRIKQTAILKSFSPAEVQYIDLLKMWLKNETEYFENIKPLLNTESKDEFIKGEIELHFFPQGDTGYFEVVKNGIKKRYLPEQLFDSELSNWEKAIDNAITYEEKLHLVNKAIFRCRKDWLDYTHPLVVKLKEKNVQHLQHIAEYLNSDRPKGGEPITKNETKTQSLTLVFSEFRFLTIPKVVILSMAAQNELIKLIATNSLPYQIAMLDYIGYLDFLKSEYFSSQYELNKHLGKWLNEGKNMRSIKGNISVLNTKSNEDRKKYTAYLHKEQVKKDYQNLK